MRYDAEKYDTKPFAAQHLTYSFFIFDGEKCVFSNGTLDELSEAFPDVESKTSHTSEKGRVRRFKDYFEKTDLFFNYKENPLGEIAIAEARKAHGLEQVKKRAALMNDIAHEYDITPASAAVAYNYINREFDVYDQELLDHLDDLMDTIHEMGFVRT